MVQEAAGESDLSDKYAKLKRQYKKLLSSGKRAAPKGGGGGADEGYEFDFDGESEAENGGAVSSAADGVHEARAAASAADGAAYADEVRRLRLR